MPVSPQTINPENLPPLAEEMAVSLTLNGISHAVMLATPADLEHFALGFCFNEGLIDSPAELRDIAIERNAQGIVLALTLSPRAEQRARERRRTMVGPTGCGLCGVDSLAAAMTLPAPVVNVNPPCAEAITRARRQLPQHQARRHQSGGLHAAALCDAEGAILRVGEDVGRHNALDKLCGALLAEGLRSGGTGESGERFVMITSRCSHDLVTKVARCAIPSLVSLSMATTLAVETAGRLNLNLVGFHGDIAHLYTTSGSAT